LELRFPVADFRIFLRDVVAGLPRIEFPAGLSLQRYSPARSGNRWTGFCLSDFVLLKVKGRQAEACQFDWVRK